MQVFRAEQNKYPSKVTKNSSSLSATALKFKLKNVINSVHLKDQ